MTTDADPSRSISRSRVLLACYWLALTVGSHWPKLELFPEPESEPIFQLDKGLHFVAFAGLTWLMIRAKIAGRSANLAWTTLVAGCIALSYAGLDEWAQRWAQRHVSFSDFAASAVGILAVVLASACTGRPLPPPRRLRAFRAAALIGAAVVIALAMPLRVNTAIYWLMRETPWPTMRIDKPCHFIAAAVITLLLALSYPAGGQRSRAGVWVTILVMGLSAPMIETVQGFSGRGIEVADIYAHEMGMAGALVAWTIVALTRALRSAGNNEPTL